VCAGAIVIRISLSLIVGQLLSAWFRLDARFALPIIACSALVAMQRRWRTLVLPACCLSAAALGLWTAGRTLEPPRAGCFVPEGDQPAKLWIEAEIAGLPSPTDEGLRVRAVVRAPGRDPERICGIVLLTIVGPAANVVVGERVRVHASLRRPRNFANPRAYDARGALARRGIWTTGYATTNGLMRIGSATRGTSLASERQRIGRLIDAALPARDAALLRALVIGDEAAVPADLWESIARAGLAHLLSVSGLHIAIVWGIAFAVVSWLLSRSEWLLLHTHVRALAALAGLFPAALYAGLAGLSVPAARSVAMTALFAASLAAAREVKNLRVLCLTAGGLAIEWPGVPLDVSFQLSFASVLSLILAAELVRERASSRLPDTGAAPLRRHLLVALLAPAAALVGTAPLVAFHFNRLTPAALLTNPMLVPLAGMPATVLGLAGAALSLVAELPARAAFALAYWPLELLQAGVAFAAALPFASMWVPTPTLVELASIYVLLGIRWVRPEYRRPTLLIALAALALDAAWWADERWLHADLRVRFLDVGQGDSAVVELPGGRVAVIDGGGFGRSSFDVGRRVVAPYLWSRRILHVDYLVATHGDWDHQGGLHFLAREFAPGELWVGARADERARLVRLEAEVEASGGIVRPLRPGEIALRAGDLRIECLHPTPDREELSANDSSLVLRIITGKRALLFMGDVEQAGEAAVVSRARPVPVAVLKVAHHGSATSSTEGFLRWARPAFAVFSLGAGNAYGFPHPLVLARFLRSGAGVLRTDRDGSVSVSIEGGRLGLRPESAASPPLCAVFGVLC
jgi:competence protein ComEC